MRAWCRVLSWILTVIGAGGVAVALLVAIDAGAWRTPLIAGALLIPGAVLGAIVEHLRRQDAIVESQREIVALLTRRLPPAEPPPM